MNFYQFPISMSSIILVLVLLFRLLHQAAMAQKLPTRDEEHFHFQISKEELFYDTNLLPDGAEVSTYLLKGVESRYFFMVEEDKSPLSVSISPCSSSIEWYIAYHNLPQEGSAEGINPDDEDDLFHQQSAKSSHKSGLVILQNYTTNSTSTYLNEQSLPGIYSIVVRAIHMDSSVRMYATTSPFSDQPYPQLPTDAYVKVISVSSSSVTLTWKPSESSRHQEVIYCVAVNRKHNFPTKCAAEAYVFGEVPPTPPPHAGFGFSWEKEKQEDFLRKAQPKPAADPDDASFQCIGSKTTYTFVNALPGQHYYFDIFAVNTVHDTSTAYVGTNATTKTKNKVIPLKDGRMHTAFLKKSRPNRIFSYEVKEPTEELIISIKPCSGRMKVKISYENDIIESAKINKISYFRVKNVKNGHVWIHVTAYKSRTASFQMVVNSDPSDNPYPDIPEDNQIHVYENNKLCNSITLGWLGTSKRQQYCLYMHTLDKSQDRKRHRRHNSCVSPHLRKKKEKVFCRKFRAKNRRRSLVKETVKGLEPGTTYIFDVYVSKPGGQSLTYGSVWASTNVTCQG